MFEFLPKDSSRPEITTEDCQNAAELFTEVLPSFFTRLSSYVQREHNTQILYLKKQEGEVNIGIALIATGPASRWYTASFRVAIDGVEKCMCTYELGDNNDLYKIRDFSAGEIIGQLLARGLLSEEQSTNMSPEELAGLVEGYRARGITAAKDRQRVGMQEMQSFLCMAVSANPIIAF